LPSPTGDQSAGDDILQKSSTKERQIIKYDNVTEKSEVILG
jgi:hypothetical protein